MQRNLKMRPRVRKGRRSEVARGGLAASTGGSGPLLAVLAGPDQRPWPIHLAGASSGPSSGKSPTPERGERQLITATAGVGFRGALSAHGQRRPWRIKLVSGLTR